MANRRYLTTRIQPLAVDWAAADRYVGIMRATALRRLLFALNIVALTLAGMVAGGGAPRAAAAIGMSGECAHRQAGPACAKMPLCDIAACAMTAIVVPASAAVASLPLSGAEYGAGPAALLPGAAPTAEPPPPKLLRAG